VRNEVVHLHRAGQRQHVTAFLTGDGDLVLGEGTGDFLQRQAVLSDLDEVVQQSCLPASQAALQSDQQAVQPPGQILVVSRIHLLSLRISRGDPGQHSRVRQRLDLFAGGGSKLAARFAWLISPTHRVG